MYFKGVELTSQKTVKYCTEYHCNKSIPLCCICISPDCSENSTKWFHISCGEHICLVCYNRIQMFFSHEKQCTEIYKWKQTWLKKAHENPTSTDFIMDKLMPMWCVCCLCKKWRQVNRDIRLCPGEINQFQCSHLIPHSNAPCEAPEDNRIEYIRKHPKNFFESIKYQPLLETVPCLDIFSDYSPDIVGVSPTAEMIDFDLKICPDFMVKFHPFLKRSKFEMAAGSVDPACVDIWEHEIFPMFSDNLKNIYLGLRNLLMVLWTSDPKRLVDDELMNRATLVHGLFRVALLIHTVPDLIRVYTALGYINQGFLNPGPRVLEDSLHKDIVVISGNLAGLVAARHLGRLGARVTVLDVSDSTSGCGRLLEGGPRPVTGAINNPVTVAAYQLSIATRQVPRQFTVYHYDGRQITDDIDDYFQGFVYGFVDWLIDEAHSKAQFQSSVQELYEQYRSKEFDSKYEDYVHVEQVYLAEIEYRIFGGTSLDKVRRDFQLTTLIRRCCNYDWRHYSGGIIEPVTSWDALREELLFGGNRVSGVVCGIEKNGGRKYEVSLEDGRKYQADKVLLSVDRWDLRRLDVERGVLEGWDEEEEDDGSVGGSFVEIRMMFRQGRGFWRRQMNQGAGTFAIVPKKGEARGFCPLFTETEDIEGNIVLQTRIFGAASAQCHRVTDGEIVARALRKLSCLSRPLNGATARPYTYEVQRQDRVLLGASVHGQRHGRVTVAKRHCKDVYLVTAAQTGPLETASVTDQFVAGLSTATSVVKDLL